MSSSDTNTGVLITDTGISTPDAADIRAVVAQDFRDVWGQDLDTSPYTPQGQLIDTLTAIINDKNSQLQFVLNQMDPEKNEGIWQEGIGKIYFITRKPAQPTTVVCQVVGLVGTVIPAGALVQDDTGREYASTASILITTPSPMNLTFQARENGPVECAAGSVNRIITMVSGWDTVENAEKGVTGNFEETRAAFENRRYDGVAKNAHGNLSSIWGAVADLDGVISVQIEENTENVARTLRGVNVNGHSFFISIVGGKDQDIARTIYQRKDGGCGYDGNTEVTVMIPTFNNTTTQKKTVVFNRPKTVDCAVKVQISTNDETPADIDQLIREAIHANWIGNTEYPRVEIGETILASRFYCIIKHIDLDFFDLVKVKVGRTNADGSISSWFDSVGFTLDEYPSISDANIRIIHGDDPDDSTGATGFWNYDPNEGGGITLNPTVNVPTEPDPNFAGDGEGTILSPESGE